MANEQNVNIVINSKNSIWLEIIDENLSILRQMILSFNYSKKIKNVEFSINFCDSETIKKYNKDYRNKDLTTDILTFQLYDNFGDTLSLGDIMINEEMLENNKDKLNNLWTLIVHGICHLNGLTHYEEDDYEIMNKKETELLNLLNINNEKLN